MRIADEIIPQGYLIQARADETTAAPLSRDTDTADTATERRGYM